MESRTECLKTIREAINFLENEDGTHGITLLTTIIPTNQ